MGLTLSHLSALDVTRLIRLQGVNIQKMDSTTLLKPIPQIGKRWCMNEFKSMNWQWDIPSKSKPLDILVPKTEGRIGMATVRNHTCWQDLPPHSILWLDEYSSIVCPELLFIQMAEIFSFPALVLLGYELCGHFTRSAHNPLEGTVKTQVPSATNVQKISNYISKISHSRGVRRAKEALRYVSDHALSAPEAVMATIYSLPTKESGYGICPITLNKRIPVHNGKRKTRFPDLLFPFAPIGINYDGNDHLDLEGFALTVCEAERAEGDSRKELMKRVREKLDAISEKVNDDNQRNLQLAAEGYIVFPITKDNLFCWGGLDSFTYSALMCANNIFGADVTKYLEVLDDTSKTHDRNELLQSMLPKGRPFGASYGTI